MITTAVDLISPEAYLGRAVASRSLSGRHDVITAVRLRHGVFVGTECGHYIRLDSVVPKGGTAACLVCAILRAKRTPG